MNKNMDLEALLELSKLLRNSDADELMKGKKSTMIISEGGPMDKSELKDKEDMINPGMPHGLVDKAMMKMDMEPKPSEEIGLAMDDNKSDEAPSYEPDEKMRKILWGR